MPSRSLAPRKVCTPRKLSEGVGRVWEIVRVSCQTKFVPLRSCQGSLTDRSCQVLFLANVAFRTFQGWMGSCQGYYPPKLSGDIFPAGVCLCVCVCVRARAHASARVSPFRFDPRQCQRLIPPTLLHRPFLRPQIPMNCLPTAAEAAAKAAPRALASRSHRWHSTNHFRPVPWRSAHKPLRSLHAHGNHHL